jgi:hypothetical protein
MYINVRRFFNHPEFLGLARGGEKLAGFVQFGMPVFRAGDEKFRGFDLPDAILGRNAVYSIHRAKTQLRK